MKSHYIYLALASCLAVTACSSVQPEKGVDSLNQIAHAESGENLVWDSSSDAQKQIDLTVQKLKSAPIDLENALKIAFLNNAGLNAELQQMGVAQADLAMAGTVRNPLLSVARISSSEATQTSLSLEFNFLDLILLSPRKKLAEYEFEQTRLDVGQKILSLSHAVRVAWYEAVAAGQQEALMQVVMQSTEAASRLAYKQVVAGTGTKREQAKKQAFFNQAKQRWLLSQAENYSAKEKLNRLMGFSADANSWELAARLPELPGERPILHNVDQSMLEKRLDIAAAKQSILFYEKQFGISRENALLEEASIGAEIEKSTGEANKKGPSVSVGLPIFNMGGTDKYRAHALLLQRQHQLNALGSDAKSEVRAAQMMQQARYDIAKRQQDVILPLRNSILAESQLRYNGMLAGVYDLLEDRQEEVEAASDYIEMLKEFWLANAALSYSLGGANDNGK